MLQFVQLSHTRCHNSCCDRIRKVYEHRSCGDLIRMVYEHRAISRQGRESNARNPEKDGRRARRTASGEEIEIETEGDKAFEHERDYKRDSESGNHSWIRVRAIRNTLMLLSSVFSSNACCGCVPS